MTENGYFNAYGHVDNAMMGHVQHYRGHGDQNYDNSGEKFIPGFYTEQFSSVPHQNAPVAKVEPIATMHDHHDYRSSMGSLHVGASSSHVPGLYEAPNNMNHYPVKQEPRQGMPPTPPGSPDDDAPEDMSMNAPSSASQLAMSMNAPSSASQPAMNASSIAAHHLLAKPVPMRRLSEKRIAEARASMNTVPPGQSQQDQQIDTEHGPSPAVAHALSLTRQTPRRARSEKKPIPEDLKDNKYFERRKRNNNAAKKSRDCRKAREDEIAIRASFLEKENAILRAQVATLREEASSLRHLVLQKRNSLQS